MISTRRIRIAAVAIVTAVAVPAMSLVAANIAQASEQSYKGKVIADSLAVRAHATTYGKKLSSLKKGTVVQISCKVTSVPVDGNNRWYHLANSKGWIAARYVKNVGAAPKETCDGELFLPGKVTGKASVNLRKGPTNKSAIVGKVKKGANVSTVCKVNGPKVDGNPRWYQLRDGRWITARYVENLQGYIPSFC